MTRGPNQPMLVRSLPPTTPMARDPKAQLVTLSYPKGTVTGTLGLMSYLFGTTLGSWLDNTVPPSSPGGRRKRKYGSRQRSNARAGRMIFLRLTDGKVFSVRITGADMDFLPYLQKAADRVTNAWTQRGTIYGPKPQDGTLN